MLFLGNLLSAECLTTKPLYTDCHTAAMFVQLSQQAAKLELTLIFSSTHYLWHTSQVISMCLLHIRLQLFTIFFYYNYTCRRVKWGEHATYETLASLP